MRTNQMDESQTAFLLIFLVVVQPAVSAVSSCPPHPHLAHLLSRELLHTTELFTCLLRSGPSEETRTSAVLPQWLLKRLLNSQ